MSTTAEAIDFWLTAWRERDWEAMAQATQLTRQAQERDLSAVLERSFGFRELARWHIDRERRYAEAATEVTVTLDFRGGHQSVAMTAHVIRETAAYRPSPRDAAEGRWGVNDISALRQQKLGRVFEGPT